MTTKSGVLFLAIASLFGGFSAASPALASEMTINSFPDKLVISTKDNRTVAFIVRKDGSRVSDAQIDVAITAGGGTLESASCQTDKCSELKTTSCRTDESGQCVFSFKAPEATGKGKIEATASMPGATKGKVSVDVDVVEVPTLSNSGWQCSDDKAIFAEIQETISCSEACSVQKDCSKSKCPEGGNAYCISAQEACECGGIEAISTTKTDTTASAKTTDKSKNSIGTTIGTIALLILIAVGLTYKIIQKRRRNRGNQIDTLTE